MKKIPQLTNQPKIIIDMIFIGISVKTSNLLYMMVCYLEIVLKFKTLFTNNTFYT